MQATGGEAPTEELIGVVRRLTAAVEQGIEMASSPEWLFHPMTRAFRDRLVAFAVDLVRRGKGLNASLVRGQISNAMAVTDPIVASLRRLDGGEVTYVRKGLVRPFWMCWDPLDDL